MIETITLENFKAFKKLDNLKIKPITILCGTNSCGKSSILQSILLLKQTLESRNLNQTFLLNGRFVHLGIFENIIFEKNRSNCINFKFCFNSNRHIPHAKQSQFPFYFILKRLLSDEQLRIPQAKYLFHYECSLRMQKESESVSYLKPVIIEHLSVRIEIKTQDHTITPGMDMKINFIEKDIYEISWKNIPVKLREEKSSGNVKVHMEFANLFPIGFRVIDRTKGDERPPEALFICLRLSDIFQNILNLYSYIGPLREEPSRRYIYENEIVEIGIKGENAAYIYSTEKDNKMIESHYFYNESTDSFLENKEGLKLNDALAKWFDLMKIYGFQPETSSELIRLNLDSNSAKKTQVNIADVGFGVSQIFPIVLEGLRMPKANTLLLEQPEIHLHPNLQMQMADYFISLALSGKKVIVETHSDHIINRLVRRIVEDKVFNLKDKIAIYFIKSTENGSVFEEVCIDDKQGVINWPNDFFDQTALEQQKIMQAGLEKRKTEKKD